MKITQGGNMNEYQRMQQMEINYIACCKLLAQMSREKEFDVKYFGQVEEALDDVVKMFPNRLYVKDGGWEGYYLMNKEGD